MLSRFEQKAIVILLTLLSLGVKILSPGRPRGELLHTPDLLAILNEVRSARSVTTVEEDMEAIAERKEVNDDDANLTMYGECRCITHPIRRRRTYGQYALLCHDYYPHLPRRAVCAGDA